jgi:membrane-associated phospholipid phosphatase
VSVGTCAVLVFATATLIDRPVADWVHAHLCDGRFDWFEATYKGHLLRLGPFSLMAGPAEALEPLAVLVFTILAILSFAGWRPGIRSRTGLALCLSVFVAVGANGVAKEIFGRTWPESWLGDNPSWIRDGVFGFFPFHGGMGWGSFPSGHTTVITTAATILWMVWPELRWVWAGAVAIVVVGLLAGNYHFVSDMIGGLYLGVGIGISVVTLMVRPNDWTRHPRRPSDPISTEGNRTDRTIVSPTASQE